MMTNRINEVEAVKKPLNGNKVSKKASKLDLILDKLGELEQRIDKLDPKHARMI
jgi:hypothetical protein